MNITECLDVADVHSPTMSAARSGFQRWRDDELALNVVDDLIELRDWTLAASKVEANDVLRALAKIGHRDQAAHSALSWLLVPGGVRLASSLRSYGPEVDPLVANQLWIAIVEHDWSRPTLVAPGVLRATKNAVFAELGIGNAARRADRAWASSVPVGERVLVDDQVEDPCAELNELLDSATAAGVITDFDRELLLDFALELDRQVLAGALPVSGRRGRAGLNSRPVALIIGQRKGLSDGAVLSRVSRRLDRLSEFAKKDLTDVPTRTHIRSLSA